MDRKLLAVGMLILNKVTREALSEKEKGGQNLDARSKQDQPDTPMGLEGGEE